MGDAPDAAAPRAWALLEVLWDLALQRCAEGWLGGGGGLKGMAFFSRMSQQLAAGENQCYLQA